MSDDEHERLAEEQEREADDLEHQSASLQEHIEDVKDEAEGLEKSETIATPDPAIEGGEAPSDDNDPPPEVRFTGKDSGDDERTDEGV
jgi:hypothetical protein